MSEIYLLFMVESCGMTRVGLQYKTMRNIGAWGVVRDVKLEVGVTFIKDMLKKIQGFV